MLQSVLIFLFIIYLCQLFARLIALPVTVIFRPAGHLLALLIWPVIIILYFLSS